MNVYDNPEKFGLRIVGEVDFGGGYSFDKFVVWTEAETPHGRVSKVGWAADSGCSCPTPFGDQGIPDLTWGTHMQCAEALEEWAKAESHSPSGNDMETVRLLTKIWNA